MSSLFGSMSIAVRSLLAQQAALNVTTNNIANVNTPGYTRAEAIITEDQPITLGSLTYGNGASLTDIQSVRDQVLELRIDQETQQQSSLNSYVNSAQQVAALFNETQGTGLQSVIDNFFNSFQALSADPSNLPLRQSVLTAGQNLTTAFNQATSNLDTIQSGLDQQVQQSVTNVNALTGQIADLNAQIGALQGAGQGAEQLIDQRNLSLNQLSQLVGISVQGSGSGPVTVTTTGGAALVAGSSGFSLDTTKDPTSGLTRIVSQGTDITGQITGGSLEGVIQARDQDIPEVQSQLDALAAGLTSAVNAAHQQGFDLSGAQGGNFFVPFVPASPGSNAGAAAAFAVALTDPSKLAASSDGSAGSSGNLAALSGVQNQNLFNGQTVDAAYSGLVNGIGNNISNATSSLNAQNLVVQQLQNQRNSISGVSLDEEASNLIRYQRAFEAAARVVTVVDEMTSTVISMGAP